MIDDRLPDGLPAEVHAADAVAGVGWGCAVELRIVVDGGYQAAAVDAAVQEAVSGAGAAGTG